MKFLAKICNVDLKTECSLGLQLIGRMLSYNVRILKFKNRELILRAR